MSDPLNQNQEGTPIDPNDPAATAASPNHAANANRRTVSYEVAVRRLKERYGYTDDELKTLFKTEAELVEFYNKTLKDGLNRRNKEADDDIGFDADDDFDLPEEEKKRLTAKKDADALADFASRDQSKFKPDARVTPEDLLQTKKDLDQLLEEDI